MGDKDKKLACGKAGGISALALGLVKVSPFTVM